MSHDSFPPARDHATRVAGALVLTFGVLFLLSNLGLVSFAVRTVVATVFVLGGAAFASMFVRDREAWWALLPAGALTGVGLTIALSATPFAGGAMLGSLGAAFLAVHFSHRSHGWALIPAGVLTTLAGVTVAGSMSGLVLFGGFAVTFLLLALRTRHARWAFIPAAVFAGIATFVFAGAVMKWLLPVVLIGVGVALLRPSTFRALTAGRVESQENPR